MREQACYEQKRRRIVPGEITRIALAKDCNLSLFRDIPVPGLGCVTLERQSASRPDSGKIGRDAEAFFVEYPPMHEVSRRNEGRVDDEQHKADVEEHRRNGVRRTRDLRDGKAVCHVKPSRARTQDYEGACLQTIGAIALRKP